MEHCWTTTWSQAVGDTIWQATTDEEGKGGWGLGWHSVDQVRSQTTSQENTKEERPQIRCRAVDIEDG